MPDGTWHTTVYTYDALRRVIATSIPYTDYNEVARTAVAEIYYDANGNKVKTIDANNTSLPEVEQKYYEAGYTATNLVLWEKYSEGAKTSYTYDAAGNRTSMTDYAQSQRKYLMRYLLDGRLEISNNRAENSIRPFVIGRKNWLLSNTPNGARASAVYYSLIISAKENGLVPFEYLAKVFTEAPNGAPIDSLMPWTV